MHCERRVCAPAFIHVDSSLSLHLFYPYVLLTLESILLQFVFAPHFLVQEIPVSEYSPHLRIPHIVCIYRLRKHCTHIL